MLNVKLNYKQIIIDASNRFNAIVNACMNSKDYSTIVGLTCASLYGGEDSMPTEHKEPVKISKESMQKKLDSMCPIKLDEVASAGFWQYYDSLRNSIGEAMGPVSYAAFKLAKYIEDQNFLAFTAEHNAGTKWVWDFVSYYEENWEY